MRVAHQSTEDRRGNALTAELTFVDIKAPRKRGAPCALGPPLRAALGRRPRAPGAPHQATTECPMCLRRGVSDSGMGNAIPPAIDPGKPSRPPPGPPALVATVRGRCSVAAPVPACSPRGWVDGRRDGSEAGLRLRHLAAGWC
jgi:hypothetical protein